MRGGEPAKGERLKGEASALQKAQSRCFTHALWFRADVLAGLMPLLRCNVKRSWKKTGSLKIGGGAAGVQGLPAPPFRTRGSERGAGEFSRTTRKCFLFRIFNELVDLMRTGQHTAFRRLAPRYSPSCFHNASTGGQARLLEATALASGCYPTDENVMSSTTGPDTGPGASASG